MKRNINYYWVEEFKNAYKMLEDALYGINSQSWDKEIVVKGSAEEMRVRLLELKLEIDLCRRKGELGRKYKKFAL